jgi:hypothetical protein
MTEEKIEMPSTGSSVGFAMGFWLIYALIVFFVLVVFFKLPF